MAITPMALEDLKSLSNKIWVLHIYNNTKITFGFWILYSKVLHHQVNWSDKNTRTSLPGYLSPSMGLKFADVPNGLAAITKVSVGMFVSWGSPTRWFQIHPPKQTWFTWKWGPLGKGDSYWKTESFPGSMLNFRGVFFNVHSYLGKWSNWLYNIFQMKPPTSQFFSTETWMCGHSWQ